MSNPAAKPSPPQTESAPDTQEEPDWQKIIRLRSIIEALQADQQALQGALHQLLEARLSEIVRLRIEIKKISSRIIQIPTTNTETTK